MVVTRKPTRKSPARRAVGTAVVAAGSSAAIAPISYRFESAPDSPVDLQPSHIKVSLGTILGHIGDFLVPALGFALLGWSISQYMPQKYGASADIMIHMQQAGDAVVRYHSSQPVIIKSEGFLVNVATATQIPVETLEHNLSVEFPKGGNVMRLEYVDRDPSVALEALRAVISNWQQVMIPVELEESVAHQVVVQPRILAEPAFPKPLQFMAAGAAFGLLFSMAWVAIARYMTSTRTA